MQQLILKNIDVKSLSFKTKKGKICNHWIFLIQDNFRDEYLADPHRSIDKNAVHELFDVGFLNLTNIIYKI